MNRLVNGAEVLEEREGFVLAKFRGSYPYVTWAIDDVGNCYHGHYFKDRWEAFLDLDKRAGSKQ